MSYSFSCQAATKALLIAAVAEKLAEVVRAQPSHDVDAKQAQATAEAFIGALPDGDTRPIAISMSGSVGWRGTWGVDHQVTSAGVSVSVHFVAAAS